MHTSLVQLETAKCLQFCGRQNNFNVTVSRFMSLFTLCLYLNEGCLRAEHTSEELGGGQRGCSDICKSEMLWYLVLKSLNLYKLTAKIERFLFGKLVQIEEWVDSFWGGGEWDSRTAIKKWNTYLVLVICTSNYLWKKTVGDSSAFVFNF